MAGHIVRIFCTANDDYSLSVRGGKIMFALADRRDKYQYWKKDDRHCTSRKDSEGQPAFALVNCATDKAIKHSPQGNLGHYLTLKPYDPDDQASVDEVLWTVPKDMNQGYTHIRRMDDISLIFTASNDNVYEANTVQLFPLRNVQHIQRWNIVPYDNLSMDLAHNDRSSQPTVKICCETRVNYNLTICDDAVMVVPSNPKDKYQHWIKESSYCKHVKDTDNRRPFALVNKATGKALKHGFGPNHFVQLTPFNWRSLDVSVLWTESGDVGNGFKNIRMQTNTSMVFDAFQIQHKDWAMVVVHPRNNNSNQRWKFEEIQPPAISS